MLSLKIKIGVTSSLIVFLLLASCGQKNTNDSGTVVVKDSAQCKEPINPNGDSELALLMRGMMKNAKSLRELIATGKIPESFPDEFMKIHTAKPTDSDTKKESFNGFADSYIFNLNELYKSTPDNIKSNYNAVINSCISCHNEHCPGPLKAIHKLSID